MVTSTSTFSLRHERAFFQTAKRIETDGVRWFVKPDENSRHFVVVVPKTVDARATRRNTLKRQLKHLFWEAEHTYPPARIVGVLKKHGHTSQSLAQALARLRHSLYTALSKGENW